MKYEIFGDDSSCNHIVIYGFVGFHCAILDEALKSLNQIKIKFGGNENSEIHCRTLFSGDSRSRSAWAHLVGHQTYYLCHEVAKTMRDLGVQSVASYADKKNIAKRLQLNFPNSDSPNKIFGYQLGDKQIQQNLYTGAAFWLHQKIGRDNFRIWVDEDKTKIEWMNGKKQVKNIYEIIKPVGSDPGKYKPLLEVADIFAYSAGRVLARDSRPCKLYFKMIYRCFSPVEASYTFVDNGNLIK